jgi:predicted nucleic acid-binding protein
MICLDTDFLIALWRSRNRPDHPARQALLRHPSEMLVVCIPVAGEFLEGAAFISEDRLQEAIRFLRLFEVSELSFQTAVRYGQLVASLRRKHQLTGISKADLWIAAWAVEHNAFLATQNIKHFRHVADLKLISFAPTA